MRSKVFRFKGMNRLFIICPIIWSISFELIDCIVDSKCLNNEFEACYYKLNDENDSVIKGEKIPIDDPKFKYGIKILLKAPYEFKRNAYGNPFPQISIHFFRSKSKIVKNVHLKLKNKNKELNDSSELLDVSLLEGKEYRWPIMIIIAPTDKSTDYILGNKDYTFFSDILVDQTTYYYSEFQSFPLTRYIDFFKNEFEIDFNDLNPKTLIGEKGGYEENSFKLNLKIYEQICAEPRLENGSSASEFKRIKVAEIKDEEKREKADAMNLMEFFKNFKYLKKIGSICTEIKETITGDIDCIKTKEGCKNFMKIEKLSSTKYQFHFFIKEKVSYMRAVFHSPIRSKDKYEVNCDRYNQFLKINLITEGKIIDANKYVNEFGSNDSLIYSTADLLYCGIIVPINAPFKIQDYELEFDLSNNTFMELNFGSLSEDRQTKVLTWYTQISLDLQFRPINETPFEDIPSLIFFASIIGSVVFLCLIFTCWFMKKYNKLSKKLTQAGSRISNLELASGVSGASRASTISGVKVTSEIYNSQVVSKPNHNKVPIKSKINEKNKANKKGGKHLGKDHKGTGVKQRK